MADLLHAIYYDPSKPGSYGGVSNLLKTARKKLPTLQRTQVEEWLQRQPTYTLHKPVLYKFPRRQVVVGGIDHQWQADLADVSTISKHNEGYTFLLTCIDVFSKYAWAIPLKRKTGQSVAEAFETIFSRGRKPLALQTDQGKEFTNERVQSLLKSEGVRFFTTYNVETKASIVERFNRTLKSRMWRYFTENLTLKYTDVLPQLVEAYNQTYHRTIDMAPAEVKVENEEALWQRMYGGDAAAVKRASKKKKEKVQVNDWVRLSKSRRTFKKGYLPNWTEELFSVVKVLPGSPPLYIVQDYRGNLLLGGLYQQEVQKVSKSDQLYRVQEVLEERPKKGGRGREIKVRWLGYPPEFDSWIDKSELKEYKTRSQA